MSNTSLDGMAEKYFTQVSEAFSQPEAASSGRSLRSFKKVYLQFTPRNGKDYPSAVDEDDLDASIDVLPIRTILYSQGLSSAAEDCFNIFDDETNFDRCHAVLYDPKESATQYFIDDEEDFDYFNQHGGDHGRDMLEAGLSEEDMLFGSGWDSDKTVTDALPHNRRERIHTEAEEIADVALRGTVPAEDGIKYFDADDLFEREEEEMLVYEKDGCYPEG